MSLNPDDWAIVAGISRYPDLSNLNSPENDAKDFYDWVTSPAPGGGGVPEEQAKLILSSDFQGLTPRPGMTPPTLQDIEAELIKLDVLANENQGKGDGLRVGRRLYLYFSGHGCAPKREETAILMANATKRRIHYLTAEPCADWFFFSRYFDEIILFMDCCNERADRVPVYCWPWMEITAPSAIVKGRRFYGYAAKWSQLAKERAYPTESDPVRGVFTLALMEGLKGAAYDPETRFVGEDGSPMARVTGKSLRNYLLNSMKDYLAEADRANPSIAKEPDVEYRNSEGDGELIFATVKVSAYPVTIDVPSHGVGGKLQVRGAGFKVLKEIAQARAQETFWLDRGFYEARILSAGLEQAFEVKGVEGDSHVVRL